jgi:hypothetical protein
MLKVFAADVVLFMWRWMRPINGSLLALSPPTTNVWTDVTSQEQIEEHLLERNRRHLEQTAREQGIRHQCRAASDNTP